jgi:hypothetical protein
MQVGQLEVRLVCLTLRLTRLSRPPSYFFKRAGLAPKFFGMFRGVVCINFGKGNVQKSRKSRSSENLSALRTTYFGILCRFIHVYSLAFTPSYLLPHVYSLTEWKKLGFSSDRPSYYLPRLSVH